MKFLLRYCLLLAAWLLIISAMQAQTIHPIGLEQVMSVADDDLTGTTRFIALAGAMTAVGGDPSAVKHNPAGLGIYRHSQFSVSANGTFRRFVQPDSKSDNPWYSRWHLSQASYVFALTHPERLSGVVSNNIMISYARRADILRIANLNDHRDQTNVAEDWIETQLDEYVQRHDIDLHYAMNVSNIVYWGVGFTFEWLQTRQTVKRYEYIAEDRRGRSMEYDLDKTANGKAAGAGFSAGLLIRPIQALRFGLSVETPIFGRMRETDYYTEDYFYPRSSSDNSHYESPNDSYSWKMTTPLIASAGLGLQWTTHGLLSLQYDLQYHQLSGIEHTARAGLEVAMTNHWMLDLGYAYSTLFSRHRGGLGFHYMGKWIRVGLAYSYSWSTAQVVDAIHHTAQGNYRAHENRIAFTFQWNS